jgi:Secretion system C-terminal sorting domain
VICVDTIASTKLFNCANNTICNGLNPNPTERSSQSTTEKFSNLRCIPNPANDQLKILYLGSETISKLTIIDVTGKIKSNQKFNINQNEIILDVSDLGQGLWFLNVQGPKTEETIKFNIIR